MRVSTGVRAPGSGLGFAGVRSVLEGFKSTKSVRIVVAFSGFQRPLGSRTCM